MANINSKFAVVNFWNVPNWEKARFQRFIFCIIILPIRNNSGIIMMICTNISPERICFYEL